MSTHEWQWKQMFHENYLPCLILINYQLWCFGMQTVSYNILQHSLRNIPYSKICHLVKGHSISLQQLISHESQEHNAIVSWHWWLSLLYGISLELLSAAGKCN